MSELRARKRLLVSESDIYRETLRLEVHNLRVYGAGVKRTFGAMGALKPLLLVAAGMFGPRLGRTFVRRRRRGWLRPLLASLLSWKVYRQVLPVVRAFMDRSREAGPGSAAAAEEQAPAAGI